MNAGLTSGILDRPENETLIARLIGAGDIVIGDRTKEPTDPPKVSLGMPAQRISQDTILTRKMLAAAAPVDVLALAQKHGVEIVDGVPIDDVRLAIAERVFE